MHVRFRLGGAVFPPTIFYKIYSHGGVTDVGTFAPRDYTAHFQPPPIKLHNHLSPNTWEVVEAVAVAEKEAGIRDHRR